MCGIAAFSLSQNSLIHPRVLGNALLSAIETRGYMAAGFAFSTPTGQMGYYKQPGLGSRMPLREMARDARTAIFHTRLATHGPVEVNDNNHPVLSPSGRIMLVHNGVIYNHNEIRRLNLENPPTFEVDTSVIPALIDEQGIKGIEHLEGDAAVAWLDAKDPGLLNLARIEHSPMSLVTLPDGSTVMASTKDLLQWSLAVAGIDFDPSKIEVIEELTHLGFRSGALEFMEDTPKPHLFHASYGSWSYRGATSGGGYKGTTVYSSNGDPWDDEEYEDAWWNEQAEKAHASRKQPRDDMWDLYGMSDHRRTGVKFFTTDYAGKQVYYRSAGDLGSAMWENYDPALWNDRLFEPYNVAHLKATGISPLPAIYFDMGHVDLWGKEHSWAQDPELMDAPMYGTNLSEVRKLAFSLHHLFYLPDSAILAAAEKPNLTGFKSAVKAIEAPKALTTDPEVIAAARSSLERPEGGEDSCALFVQPPLQQGPIHPEMADPQRQW